MDLLHDLVLRLLVERLERAERLQACKRGSQRLCKESANGRGGEFSAHARERRPRNEPRPASLAAAAAAAAASLARGGGGAGGRWRRPGGGGGSRASERATVRDASDAWRTASRRAAMRGSGRMCAEELARTPAARVGPAVAAFLQCPSGSYHDGGAARLCVERGVGVCDLEERLLISESKIAICSIMRPRAVKSSPAPIYCGKSNRYVFFF